MHLCPMDVHAVGNCDIPVKQMSLFEPKDFPLCGVQRKLTVITFSII